MTKIRLPAFTLIEVAIVLMIVGLMAGAVLKGYDLLEGAKMRAIVSDVQRYQLAFDLYHEAYNAIPGDDAKATEYFGPDVPNGNGNGYIDEGERQAVWQHLAKGGFIASESPPTSKMGGRFTVVFQPSVSLSGHWLMLGKENGTKADGGMFTPKQAQQLKNKIDSGIASNQEGQVRFQEGAGHSPGQCVQGRGFNLSVTAPTCVALFRINGF
jgi:hypothetical protein